MKNQKLILSILLLGMFWKGYTQITPGTYTITTKLIDRRLDIKWADKNNGAGLHIWDPNGGEAQKFKVENSNEADYYYIKSEWGKCLTVNGSDPNILDMWDCVNGNNQKWKFIDTRDDHHNIQSKLGTYIDVRWGKKDNGSEVGMSGYSNWEGNVAQRWKMNSDRISGGIGGIFSTSTTINTSKMTKFDPSKHGFKFENNFTVQSQFAGFNGPSFGGLCGGMVYAAFDYYNCNIKIPQQNYMPAEGMPLQSYLWGRQQNSFFPNLDRWIEYGFNPFGSRNRDFYIWGIELGSGQFGQVKASIDKGIPIPIGLIACGNDCQCQDGCPGNHVVLVIGYDMGRYKGDKGDFVEDLKLFIYDPNFPNQIKTLKPNHRNAMYEMEGDARYKWRTYFANTKYSQNTPPIIADNPNELQITFRTGGDDLRGGNDNLNILVMLKNGSLRFDNVNNGKRWVDQSFQTIGLPLPINTFNNDIIGVKLETTFGGGTGGDNWNLDKLVIKTRLNRIVESVLVLGSENNLLYRFTGDSKSREFIRPGITPNEVVVEFCTGGDDLRGGNDNVNLILLLNNGTELSFPNVNEGRNWPNKSVNTIKRTIPDRIKKEEIKGIKLQTTFGGGFGGDNWNLDKIVSFVNINGSRQNILEYGSLSNLLFRFTGDNKVKEFNKNK